ncbi:putative superoxide reductase [Candidatus Moduliflexus flocculans]|uniref:Putative superoxide reductase n=1 Tax=Candidatus Moduliflexus flocculans TaxID=1499966 RepID=A0A081BNB5_9BACT|nr:putative superoxide reductase [Candidatus Moduliflexus flocculans]
MGFAALVHSPDFEGKEKHVPSMTLSDSAIGTVVTVQVGKDVLHPTTPEHHIEWVKVFGETQEGKIVEVATLTFGKGTSLPSGSIVIKKENYKSLTALSYCNLHGVWDNSLTL